MIKVNSTSCDYKPYAAADCRPGETLVDQDGDLFLCAVSDESGSKYWIHIYTRDRGKAVICDTDLDDVPNGPCLVVGRKCDLEITIKLAD